MLAFETLAHAAAGPPIDRTRALLSRTERDGSTPTMPLQSAFIAPLVEGAARDWLLCGLMRRLRRPTPFP